MKKILVLVIALMFTGTIYAQRADSPHKSPEDRAAKQAENMKQKLGLSDQQYASIRSINLKYAERISKLRADTATAREDRHKQMRDLHTQKQSEITQVLSDEQQAKWKTLREDQRNKAGARQGRKGAGSESDWKKSLSLSDEQSARLDEAHTAFREKIRTIRDDEKLSEEQRKEKAKAVRAEHESEVKSILSEEQFRKWKEMKKDGKKLKQEHYYKNRK